MPKPYPDMIINNTEQVMEYANLATDNLYGVGIMIIILVGLFTLFKYQGNMISDSLAASFALSLVLGALLWAGGFLAGEIIGILLLGLVCSVLYMAVEH